MAAEGEERLLRAVARGGDPVGAQPHPGEEGDQGDVVEDLRVEEVPGGAEQDPLHPPVQGFVFHRCRHLPGREFGAGRREEYTTVQTSRSSGEEDIRYSRTSRLCSPPLWSLTKFRYVAARTKPIFSKARTAAACSSITSAMR